MTVPPNWKAVEDNAEWQRQLAIKTANQSAIDIGALYPELYKPWIKSFSNSIGTHLIPDVLTSPCVLVDLYNWPSESDLIKVYGIDLDFLLHLRDKEHVILCANLAPEEYVDSMWLHSTLADKRTIFRSVRTPLFFESKQKEFSVKCNEFKERIQRHLEQKSNSEIEKLIRLARTAHPVDGLENLAAVLSYWGKRLAVMNPEMEPVVAELETHPEKVIKEISQRQFFEVRPFTGGLGGYVRQTVNSIRDMFPNDLEIEDLPEEIILSISSLNSFIAKNVTNIQAEDLSNEAYWSNLTVTERLRLIEVLDNREEREEAIKAEEWMRKMLMRAGREKWTEQQITQYANDQRERWDRLSSHLTFGVAAGSLAAIVAGELNTAAYIGAVGFGAKLLGNTLSRPVVEGLVPRIQFVRFVKKRGP